jgi:hypothetical protein
MQNAPGVTDEQRQIIYQLNQELNNMNSWLSQVRQDAIKLEHMTDTELLLPSSLSLLNDMTAQALYAYIGRLAPDTNQVQGGAVQVGYDLQRLTHFDIRPFIRNH